MSSVLGKDAGLVSCPATAGAARPRSATAVEATGGPSESAAILSAYRNGGGLASGDDLGRLLEKRRRGDDPSLARLLAAHRIFGFRCRQTLWIPMFQLDPHDLSVAPGPSRVLAEWGDALDAWGLARWFVAANAGLADRRPVDVVAIDLAGVLEAARSDRARFVRP